MGVIFAILVSIYNSENIVNISKDYLVIFTGIFLLMLLNYISIYIRLHQIKISDFPDSDTLNYLESKENNGVIISYRKDYLLKMISDIKDICGKFDIDYFFNNRIINTSDIMFFMFLGIGGIVLIYVFIGCDVPVILNFIFLFAATFILSGYFVTLLISLTGLSSKCKLIVVNKSSLSFVFCFVLLTILFLPVFIFII